MRFDMFDYSICKVPAVSGPGQIVWRADNAIQTLFQPQATVRWLFDARPVSISAAQGS